MYPNLLAEMARYGYTNQDLAKATQKNLSTISLKLNGKKDFYKNEILDIRNKLFPECSLEYLFEEKKRTPTIDKEYSPKE